MQVNQRRHDRLSADVLHIGVFRNGDASGFSGGNDVIAVDDEHGILDRWLACSINQPRALEGDLSLSPSKRADNQSGQKNPQFYTSVPTIDGFHVAPPC